MLNCAPGSRRGRVCSEAPVKTPCHRTNAPSREASGAAPARVQRHPGSARSPRRPPRHRPPRCPPRHLHPRCPRIPCACLASTPSHPIGTPSHPIPSILDGGPSHPFHPSCRPKRPRGVHTQTLIQAPTMIVCNLDGPHCGSYGVCSMK